MSKRLLRNKGRGLRPRSGQSRPSAGGEAAPVDRVDASSFYDERDDDEIVAESTADEVAARAADEAARKAEEARKAEAAHDPSLSLARADDAKRKAEEQLRKAEEAKRAAEEILRKAEEAKRAAELSAKQAEEEARRVLEEARRAEEDAKRIAEEARKVEEEEKALAAKRAEEDARKKAEEDARKKAEEDAKKKAKEEASAAADKADAEKAEAAKKAEAEAKIPADKAEAAKKADDEAPKSSARGKAQDGSPRSGKGKDDAPTSHRPDSKSTSGHQWGEDSSVSARFFRQDVDSVPPAESHPEDHDLFGHAVSAETLKRRARFRQFVAGVVAFAAVVCIFVVGQRMMNRAGPAPSSPTVQAQTAAPSEDQKKAAEAKAAEEAKKKAEEEEAKKKAEEEAKKKAEEEAKRRNVDVDALKKKGMAEVNSFRFKDAIETGKALIDADPEEATGYFVLGAALQSTGKWKEGVEQYNECVRKAKKGPVNECVANGGRK